MENADFAGRVAVITGAWRGLGRAAAARLHERGASVAVNVRNRERAELLAKEIGERAFAVPGDVAADGVPDEIARRTLERFGRIDILVNNAALPLSTRLPDLSAEEWRRVIEVNLTAPFLMTKTVLPAMRAQHFGRIINISSSAGRMVSTLRHAKSFPAGIERVGRRRDGQSSARSERTGVSESIEARAHAFHQESHTHCVTRKRSRRESNPHLRFRKPLFYPLNYGN
jgi:NAD(P)-dependent dehydrogenase (short-subunit alcohol dehydrogenase family)